MECLRCDSELLLGTIREGVANDLAAPCDSLGPGRFSLIPALLMMVFFCDVVDKEDVGVISEKRVVLRGSWVCCDVEGTTLEGPAIKRFVSTVERSPTGPLA